MKNQNDLAYLTMMEDLFLYTPKPSQELAELLKKYINLNLTDDNKKILELKYGLNCHKHSLKEIIEYFQNSREGGHFLNKTSRINNRLDQIRCNFRERISYSTEDLSITKEIIKHIKEYDEEKE